MKMKFGAAMLGLARLGCAMAVGLTCGSTFAQQYPAKPIRLVVPYAAGGAADAVVRPLTKELSDVLGQSVAADFSPGAGGTIAAAKVAVAPADGYTLLLGSNGALTTGPHLGKVNYDPIKGFAHVARIANSQYVLLVPATSPIRNLQDLLRAAADKSRPLSCGTPGVGSIGHFALELLKNSTGASLNHVSYRGGSPMTVDLLGGRLDMALGGLATAVPLIHRGELRAIGVTGTVRSQALPQVPTLQELGLKDFDATAFWGISAPQGTPAAVVRRLEEALRTVVAMPAVTTYWVSAGQDPAYSNAADYQVYLRKDYDKWGLIAQRAGIRNE